MPKPFYVTTPIYYVNARPHLGHAYTTIVADVMTRFHSMYGTETFFLTGTDEHGDKVVQAAVKENLSPRTYVDKISRLFRELWPQLNIEYSAFIRTTDPAHMEIVRQILQKIHAGGDIYCLGEYPGGRSWRIGLEHPRDADEILTVLELKNRAVATSGDYRNYFIRSRLRYSHIIDPRTGQPSRSKVVEVSVMAPDCLTADGLATAMFLMGADRGINLLKQIEDVDGVIVTEEDGDIKLYFSDNSPQRQ